MTPREWDALLAPSVSKADVWVLVERAARAVLENVDPKRILSTNNVVQMLYPREAVQSVSADNARDRIYAALLVLATKGLSDCCHRGEPQGVFMGRPKRPWLWHKPVAVEVCPTCGQPVTLVLK